MVALRHYRGRRVTSTLEAVVDLKAPGRLLAEARAPPAVERLLAEAQAPSAVEAQAPSAVERLLAAAQVPLAFAGSFLAEGRVLVVGR